MASDDTYPPGHGMYYAYIRGEERRMQKVGEVLALKGSRMVDPNMFFPKINSSSKALAKVADARKAVSQRVWHDRLYDGGRREYAADAYSGESFERLSVAEKAYLRNEKLERERGWNAIGKSSAREALTMPAPPVIRGPSPSDRSEKKSANGAPAIGPDARDTFAPYSTILSRLSLPRGPPPRPPFLLPPTIDLPTPAAGPTRVRQAFSHYGAGAALWLHSSNDVRALLAWQQPSSSTAMVLQYQLEYKSRVRTDLLTKTEHNLNEFIKAYSRSNGAFARSSGDFGVVSSDSWQELLTVDGRTTSIHVPNLLPYMSYEFRVKAANINGFGGPSEVVKVDAMCITPPIDVVELVPTQRAAAVRWQTPLLPLIADGTGVAVEQFELHWREVGKINWNVATVGPTSNSYTVTNLCPNTVHELRICGAYTTGVGPPSKPHRFTTHFNATGPPRPIIVKAGFVSSALVMTWETPNDFKAAHYEVQMTEILDVVKPGGPESVTFTARGNSYVVKGLPDASRHEIRVRSRTSDGFASPWTDSLIVAVLPGAVFETADMSPNTEAEEEDQEDHEHQG